MSNPTGERLYNLLPSVYRVRDAKNNDALRALLGVIENQLRLLEDDIGRLYDNLFIETCDEWVVPYLGDLLGVRGLRPVRDGAYSQRALVANTLGYRRRKGTVAVLEQLARDVTGWPAKAVEFFELLATTQHLNHVRPGRGGMVDLRDIARLAPVDGPFDRTAHTADLRHIDYGGGRYNVPNVGLFLWRLQPYFVAHATASPLSEPSDGRYRFSPLGNDAALFNRPRTETEITQLAGEQNVPGPLRRRPLYDELEARRQALVDEETPREVYFGAQPVLQVFVNGSSEAVPPERITICDLSDPPSSIPEGWSRLATTKSYEPTSGGLPQRRDIEVAVDPVLGRLAFPKGVTPDQVQVSCAYGFPGDLGGGPYERRETLAAPSRTPREQWSKTVSRHDPQADCQSLSEALADWDRLAGRNRDDGTITITDSATYIEALTIRLAKDERFVIQAANGVRPVLRCSDHRGDLVVSAREPDTPSTASLTLNGLLIEGGILVEQRALERLRILHCTLVPGRGLGADGRPLEPDLASITVADPNPRLRVEIDRSIVGALRLPAGMDGLQVRDSIVSSNQARVMPALISRTLSSVRLSAENPAVNVTIGGDGPHTAVLPTDRDKPTTVPKAREQLEAAIRAAHDSPAFKNACVITVPGVNRLIVLPGVVGTVIVEPAETDPTASDLGLDRGSVRDANAFVGEPLSSFTGLSSESSSLNVTIGGEGPATISLTGDPTTVVQARNSLQQAIQAVPQVSIPTLVGNVKDRLIVLPAVEGATAVFSAASDDDTTLAELGLRSDRPAIAASENGGDPGPSTTLERTTVFGAVHVDELVLASEAIITDSVRAERRQTGFVRFSYMPEGSRTPRRFRCQPDLAIHRALEAASKTRPSLTPAEQDRIRNQVRTRVVPSFTSVHYGEPGYAQLSWTGAEEILTGAEDENEMGAFNFLQQAQRIQSLRVSLDEYLRLGLEAGVIPVN